MEPTRESLIKDLHLEAKAEGGYFLPTYTAPMKIDSSRATMSVIYAMLTTESPIIPFNVNRSSDVTHYFHCGLPVKFHMLTASGEYSYAVLGTDVDAQQQPLVVVPVGHWKALELMTDSGKTTPDYGLFSEVSTPEFRREDWHIGTEDELKKIIPPDKWDELKKFIQK